MDGAFEVGQIFVNGGLLDRVWGIEVPLGEVVAIRAICRHGIDGCVASRSSGSALTASPISSRRMRTASRVSPPAGRQLQVGADRVDRSLDRPAADAPGNSQRDQVRFDSFLDAWFEVGGGDQVDPGAEDAFEVGLEAA